MPSNHPTSPENYRGRFAPSPTGELHRGSLLAAVASFLQARSQRGEWLVRIEDIDPPREVPGSADAIVSDLARLGMHPDRPVMYQNRNLQNYRQARDQLLASGQAFYCTCSRRQLKGETVYPGYCRQRKCQATAVRLRVGPGQIEFSDHLQGSQRLDPESVIGDFIIWRADDLPAYQLAVVIDDAAMGITEVVRGMDLLDSTPRQICLQEALGLPRPDYLHIPLLLDSEGRKLSKSDADLPVTSLPPITLLRDSLDLLGHPPPPGIVELDKLWAWAIDHWQPQNIPDRLRSDQIA